MQSDGNGKSSVERAVALLAPTPGRSPLWVIAAAIVPTLAVFGIELFFWHSAGRWSLFYPAVLACAWFGGGASGIIATLLATALMWWQFVPPEHVLLKPGGEDYAVALVFVLTGIVVSLVIHRYRRNADELVRSHLILQTILDYSPDAIAVKDRESRYLLVSKAFERLAGLKASAVVGLTAVDVFPPAVANKALAADETIRTTRAPGQFEVELPDGRDILVTEFPLLDKSNNLFAIGAIETDISQRKRDEQTVREALEDLRTAQHVSHVGSWRWDFRTNGAKWSDELYQIFGVDPARPPAPLVYPAATLLTTDSLARLRGALDKLRVDGKPYELDIEFTRPDGATRWCAARGEAVCDASGRIIGVNGTIADITHIKELELLRKEWTAIVAHDLRQPLGVISAGREILPDLHAGEDEEERAILKRIISSTQALTRMIDDLMDMSLLEANRLKLERTSADPEKVVRESVERLQQLVNVPIQTQVSGPPISVSIDAMRIEQVLSNLLLNAAKHGEPDSPIEVRMHRTGGEVEIAVTNSGKGIESSELPRLFDRFTRSKSTQRSGVSGLGLGLYISKGIIEAHGGRLWADSVPGKSTTFHLSLPTAVSRLQAA
jgi:PAS domain S-box-containing protein